MNKEKISCSHALLKFFQQSRYTHFIQNSLKILSGPKSQAKVVELKINYWEQENYLKKIGSKNILKPKETKNQKQTHTQT